MVQRGMHERLQRTLIPLVVFVLSIEILGQVALSIPSFMGRLEGATRTGRRLASIQRARSALEGGRHELGQIATGSLTDDPLLGWRHTEGSWLDGQQTTNARGERITGPSDAPDGSPRITLLGDSFTFGDEVADAETWGWQLREACQCTVRNLGTLGYGLDQMTLRWEAEAPPTEVAIIGLTPVTELRTGLTWDAWAKPSFRFRGGALTLQDSPLPPAGELVDQQWRLATPWLWAMWRERLVEPPLDHRTLAALNDALRDRLAARMHADGVTPVWVWMAMKGEYDGPPSNANTQWQRWCREHPDEICIDTTPALRELHESGVPLTRVAHWTPAGNTRVATLLTEALTARGLVP